MVVLHRVEQAAVDIVATRHSRCEAAVNNLLYDLALSSLQGAPIVRKLPSTSNPHGSDLAALPRKALGAAVAAVAGAGAVASTPAEAATFTVTNLADAGTGSLRQAIDDANGAAGADNIVFQAGLSGTITLATGQLSITDSVTITGPGAANLSVSGNNASRVFYLYNGTAEIAVTLSGMTVRGGAATIGAGIINFDEDLTLDGMTITGNAASGDGGGLWADGFVMDLTIQNSTISGNTAGDDGGGVYVEDTGGAVTISNTVVSGNTATGNGGGIYLYDPDDDVTISGSSISGNTSSAAGGGVYLYSFDGTAQLRVNTSTVSGNSAAAGGGLFLYGMDTGFQMENTTVSGNQASAGDGGGVYVYDSYTGLRGAAAVAVRHSTIAANTATGTAGGVFIGSGNGSLVHTVAGDNSAPSNADLGGGGSFVVANSLIEAPGTATITNNGGNLLNQDPQLGALANNGGPTQTHLPALASPAVNAGDAAFAPPPSTDQRGNPRVSGGRIDIGAVERGVSSVEFAQATASVAEEAGSVNLLVNRSAGDGAVSVNFATTAGSATAGSDYTTTNGTLNWAAGDLAAKTVTVPILNDAAPEATETFTVALSNPTGATLGATTVSTVSITDTDVATGSVGFATVSATVDEAAGTVVVQVSRTGGSGGAATVSFTTNPGTALAGSDYTTTTGTLNWADGDAAPKSITVPILNDAVPEPTENFTLTLSNATGATLGANTVATISITDTDMPPGSVGLATTTASVDEAAGTLLVQVNRIGGSGGAATVNFSTSPGTALAGSDYTTTTGTLNWADGDGTPKSITIPILDNALPEPSETFTVNLSNATGATLGANVTSTVTITDTDVAIQLPATSTAGKLALAMGIALLGWLGMRRRQLLQIMLPALFGLLMLGVAPDSHAATARGKAQQIAGLFADSSTAGAQTKVTLADGRSVAVDSSRLEVRDTRRRAAVAITGLAAIPAGTPVTLKTRRNADGSIRKVVLRLHDTLTVAQREAAQAK